MSKLGRSLRVFLALQVAQLNRLIGMAGNDVGEPQIIMAGLLLSLPTPKPSCPCSNLSPSHPSTALLPTPQRWLGALRFDSWRADKCGRVVRLYPKGGH